MWTEFNYYHYSSNRELVEIKANGYYKPVSVGVAQLINQTNLATTSSSTGMVSTSAASSTYSMGVFSSTSGTSSSTSSISSTAGSSYAGLVSGTAAGAVSGADFSPGSIGDATLNNLQTMEMITPNIIVTYNHGKVVPVDFERLQAKALNILSSWYITKSTYDRNRLNSILNINYQPMFKGNYPLKFYYNYNGCLDVDADMPTISKPFIY